MAQRGRRPGARGTRAEVLSAARQLFLEQGFNQTAMTAVARRAGVDTSLLYHYFGTKVNLFIESLLGTPFPVGVEETPWAGQVHEGRDIETRRFSHSGSERVMRRAERSSQLLKPHLGRPKRPKRSSGLLQRESGQQFDCA